uniref:Putative secreted protein n=1 Tax=Anopheles triannulatus TaxID=58253 RepID=A0A2M4B4D9_9DIPT
MCLLKVLGKLVLVVELLRAEVATVERAIVHSTVDFQYLDLATLLNLFTFRLRLAGILVHFLGRRIFPSQLQLVYMLLEHLLLFPLHQDFVLFLYHHGVFVDVIHLLLYLRHEP